MRDYNAYLAELAGVQLADVKHLILVDSKSPVSFFAYPGKPSLLAPDGCRLHPVAPIDFDLNDALEDNPRGVLIAFVLGLVSASCIALAW